MLERGEDGERVMAHLRAVCQTPAALSCCISRIRARQMSTHVLPNGVAEAMSAHVHEAGVAAFLTLPLHEMVRVQRAHKWDAEWSEEAERALAGLRLLPDNLSALVLSPSEQVALKRARESTLMNKQEALLHVHDASAWLRHVIELARTSRAEMTLARLTLPLLLLSGRRSTEMLNGTSTFLPTPRATTCFFDGQIKKRGAHARAYEIPLLCDFATFAHALGALRAKQGFQQLGTVECNNRYHKLLNQGTRAFAPTLSHAHQLRSVYVAYVCRMYTCDVTFNAACMRILGHEKLETSLSYNSVVLHSVQDDLPACGPLP